MYWIKQNNKTIILTKFYKLSKGIILNNNTLTKYIDSFWNDILSVNPSRYNIHTLILCKVQFNNNQTRTLAGMRKVNFSDKDLFTKYLLARLGIINDNYKKLL